MLYYEKHITSPLKDWVVLIHGAGGSIATWKRQMIVLKNDFNLLIPDLRDHGQSIHFSDDIYTFDLIIKDIKQVLDKESIKKAHFITLSFGSVIAQRLSIHYPGLVKSLITAGGVFRGSFAIKTFVHVARFFNLFLPYAWMYKIFSYLLMPFKRHQASRRVYWTQAKKISPVAYMKWVGLYGEFFQLLESFFNQNIKFPLLVVMGSEDYIFLGAAKRFVKSHPTSRLEIIRNAGHICNIDNYSRFNELAVSFLLSPIHSNC